MSTTHGFRLWYAVLGSIAAWIVHLIAVASLAEYVCAHDTTWLLHALTAVLGAATVVALLLAVELARSCPDDRIALGERTASVAFLGRVGIIIGVADLVLILFEGLLVVWISPCA